MQSYLLLILAFCGYPIYPKEKKIRKFEFWARSGWSQNFRQVILVRELTCHAFYTWASDWDIWGKPIPRYDTNTLIVFYCIVSYRIVSYRIVSCRVVSCRVVSCRVVSCRVVSYRIVSHRIVSYRIVPMNPSWEGALCNRRHRLLRLAALLQTW